MADTGAQLNRIDVSTRTARISTALRESIRVMPDVVPTELRQQMAKALSTLERDEVHIAVAGLFKAGKSTLINRLAGAEILPSSGFPETGAPALLRRRRPLSARVSTGHGETIAIAPTPQSIAQYTSLYTPDGIRRPNREIAQYIEIDAPALRVARNMVLIDLPGLRDTAEMDAIALDMALEADLILWVFRSEPAFSEQDAGFLEYLVSTCGAHVIVPVLNGFLDEHGGRLWKMFLRDKLPAHLSALRSAGPTIGLEATQVDEILAVDASQMRRRWFGETFGARTIDRFLKRVGKRSSSEVKLARFKRVARTAELARQYIETPLTSERTLYEAQLMLFNAYVDRQRRRKELSEEINRALDDAFAGLTDELRAAGVVAAARARSLSFSVGADVSSALAEAATQIVWRRASELTQRAISVGRDSEFGPISDGAVELIAGTMALSAHNGSAFEIVSHSVHAAVGTVIFDQPKLSWGRVASWLKGEDSEVAASRDRACKALNERAMRVAELVQNRRSSVRSVIDKTLILKPLEFVPSPSKTKLDELEQATASLDVLLRILH